MKIPDNLPPELAGKNLDIIARLQARKSLDSLQESKRGEIVNNSHNIWLKRAVQPFMKLDNLTDEMIGGIDKTLWK
jgi:hypothetical protein